MSGSKLGKLLIIRTVCQKEMMTSQKIRIDKWLWAARFFRSRTLAAGAVNGGKVHVNGQRVKSARTVQIGDTIDITCGQQRATVKVFLLSSKRGPAKAAQRLYEETQESVARREISIQQRKLLNAGLSQTRGRPDKRQRRQLRKASGKS